MDLERGVGSGVAEAGTVLNPHVQPGRSGARHGFQFVPTGKIVIEQFAPVGEPQPCLGKVLGRQAVVVDLHVDVASVERAADQRDVNTLHTPIFAGIPDPTQTNGENARRTSAIQTPAGS